MVASSLAKDAEESSEAKEQIVEEIDQDFDAEEDNAEDKKADTNVENANLVTKVSLKKNLSGEDNPEEPKDKEPIKVVVGVP